MSMRSSITSPYSRSVTCSPTYVDEIVYYESILTKGTVLETITSPAWQARSTQCLPTKVMLCVTQSSVGLALIFFPYCCECDVDIRRDMHVRLCSRSTTNSMVCLKSIPFCPRTLPRAHGGLGRSTCPPDTRRPRLSCPFRDARRTCRTQCPSTKLHSASHRP